MNTEICVTCEPTIKEEAVSCPVCFTEEGLRELNGCGHSICGDCENSLKRTPGQNTETLGLSVKYIKCPLCRQYEKKTYEQLEAELIYYRDRTPIDRGLLSIQDIYYEEARINARIVQLRNRRNDLLIASGARPDAAQGIATAITTTNQPPVNPLNDQPFHQQAAETYTRLDGTIGIYNSQEANQRASEGIRRDQERRFVLAGMMGAGRSVPRRIRCAGEGCNTPAATQRRCPNHATIPCCRRCNTCDDCP